MPTRSETAPDATLSVNDLPSAMIFCRCCSVKSTTIVSPSERRWLSAESATDPPVACIDIFEVSAVLARTNSSSSMRSVPAPRSKAEPVTAGAAVSDTTDSAYRPDCPLVRALWAAWPLGWVNALPAPSRNALGCSFRSERPLEATSAFVTRTSGNAALSANAKAAPGGNETGSMACAFWAGVRASPTTLELAAGSDAPASDMLEPEDEQGLELGVQPSRRIFETSAVATFIISLNAMFSFPVEMSKLERAVE